MTALQMLYQYIAQKAFGTLGNSPLVPTAFFTDNLMTLGE